MTRALEELDLCRREWAAICPAERRVRDNRFKRKNNADALTCHRSCRGRCGCPPQLSSPRRPSRPRRRDYWRCAGQCLPTKHTRGHATLWRPFVRGDGHSGRIATGMASIEYAVVVRWVRRPARLLASNTRAASTAAAGVVAGECVSLVFTFESIIANPPFGRTYGCPFSPTEV